MHVDAEIRLGPSSRYVNTPAFRKAEEGLFWGIWEKVDFPPREDDTYQEIHRKDFPRFDLLSNKFYGDPNLWWVLCQANGINNFLELQSQFSQKARTPKIYNELGLLTFQAKALATGPDFNTGDRSGLIIHVRPEELDIYVGLELDVVQNTSPTPRESFTGLSPYPADVLDFWGNIESSLIEIDWLSPYLLKPEFGGTRDAPMPPEGFFQFWGGVDEKTMVLRIPSPDHVSEKLE